MAQRLRAVPGRSLERAGTDRKREPAATGRSDRAVELRAELLPPIGQHRVPLRSELTFRALRLRGGRGQGAEQGGGHQVPQASRHPIWISLVIRMSGARDDITEQYFSTDRSMALRALGSSRPVPDILKTKLTRM